MWNGSKFLTTIFFCEAKEQHIKISLTKNSLTEKKKEI